jgi:ankyrin repeat protein
MRVIAVLLLGVVAEARRPSHQVGANTKTRSKDRLTALDLAHKYGHANLIKSLER